MKYDISAWALLFPGPPVPTVAVWDSPALCLHPGGLLLSLEISSPARAWEDLFHGIPSSKRTHAHGVLWMHASPLQAALSSRETLRCCYWVLIGLVELVGEARRT